MSEHKRFQRKMLCSGISLTHSVDLMPEGKFPILMNVRSSKTGEIMPRQGLASINPTPLLSVTDASTNVHSIRRMDNSIPGAVWPFTRFVGVGRDIFSGVNAGQTLFNQQDYAYSGKPLSMIPFRPDRSPEPWLYVGDSVKMRKFRGDGENFRMGIAPPNKPPDVTLAQPLFSQVAYLTSDVSISTPPVAVEYDNNVSPGWCSIAVGPSVEWTRGMFLVNATTLETVPVHDVFSSITSTSAVGLLYDSGATGICCVQPVTPMPGLKPDMLVALYDGVTTEFVRVLSVGEGPDHNFSFRCSTANTFGPGVNIIGTVTLRCYTGTMWTSAHVLERRFHRDVVPAPTTFQFDSGIVGDMSNVGGRPMLESDIIHYSMRVSDPAAISEGRLMFMIDSQNYFYKTFRPNDLQPNASGTQTAEQTAAIQAERNAIAQASDANLAGTNLFNLSEQNAILKAQAQGLIYGIDVPSTQPSIDPSAQMVTGASQWTEFFFRYADFIRVGSDQSRSWKDVTVARLQVVVLATVALDSADLWIGGGFGADIGGTGEDIFYRYRARSKATGAKGNPSPATRAGVRARRERVVISVAVAHPDPQVDVLDIFRFGAGLAEWKYVGSVPNLATSPFEDDHAAIDLISAPVLEFDNYQPVPTIDLPRTGTCAVSGTSVLDTGGDNFNMSWAAGSQIEIDGVYYTLYASPSSTSRLETVESIGSQSSANWNMQQATLLAYPPADYAAPASVTLPRLWGPYGEGETGVFLFGCGEVFQPGTLYWLKGSDPDSAPDRYQLEVTSPADPLINGCVYDTRAYVWSSLFQYQILPDGRGGFIAHKIPGSYGLVGKWAFCSNGPLMWYVGPDGIYETGGGPSMNITDADLFPLFPHPGTKQEAVNGYSPIDFDNHLDSMRLAYGNGFLFFDYVDLSGIPRCLVFDIKAKAWYSDLYNAVGFINAHYREEGYSAEQVDLLSTNGFIYYYTGVSDAGSVISAQVRTPSFDAGDSRATKIWGDILVDINADTASVSVTPMYDNQTNSLPTTAITGATREASRTIIDLGTGSGFEARNLALDIVWLSSTRTPALYEWQPSLLPRPEVTLKRATDFTDDGYNGAKFFQGISIEADTGGALRTVQVEYYDDAGVLNVLPVNVSHAGKLEKPYGFPAAFVASEVRLRPTDANSWKLYSVRWIWIKKPDLARIEQDWTDADYFGAKYLQGVMIEADTRTENGSTAAVVIIVQVDGTTFASLTINHNGQLEKPYSFSSTIIGHEFKLLPQAPLRNFKYAFIYTKKAEYFKLIQDWTDDGHPGTKLIQAAFFEVDTQGANVTLQIQADGAVNASIILNSSGQAIIPYSFDPFLARLLRVVPLADLRFFRVNWVWVKKPELFAFQDDWTDCGEFSDKFVQGIMVEADTEGQNVVLNVYKDGDMSIVIKQIQINHVGQVEKPYSFDSTFFAHSLKIVPFNPGSHPIRQFKYAWIYTKQPERFALINDWSDVGVLGSKYFQGVIIEADTLNVPIQVQVQTDSGVVLQTLTCQHNGRVEIAYAFNPAVIRTEIRLVPLGNWRLYASRWIKVDKPELAAFWGDWQDDGYIGAKFMQGVVIEADTEGATIPVEIQYDGGTVATTLSVNQNGQTAQAYSFDPPFIAHTLRIVPQGNWRFFKVKWVWEPHPELAKNWETQGTTHDMAAWGHLRAGWVALVSTADVTLQITVDGVPYSYTLPATAGLELKRYFVAAPAKGKITSYKLSSTQPFRLFQKDCALLVKAWGDPGPYRPVNPFGDISRIAGARI